MSSKPQQKPLRIGSSPLEVFYNKEILKHLEEFIGKHLCQSFLFHKFTGSEAVTRRCSINKVFLKILQNSQKNTRARHASCRPQACTLSKKGLQNRCFLVNFARFSRTLISYKICEWPLVKDVNISELYYFLVVGFKDFRTAIFKTPPNGSVLIQYSSL